MMLLELVNFAKLFPIDFRGYHFVIAALCLHGHNGIETIECKRCCAKHSAEERESRSLPQTTVRGAEKPRLSDLGYLRSNVPIGSAATTVNPRLKQKFLFFELVQLRKRSKLRSLTEACSRYVSSRVNGDVLMTIVNP